MKISYNWLKEYIDIDLPVEELTDILTSIGLEVAGVETYESVPGGLKGCVTGKVLSCKKHPNADKLSITEVDIGENRPLTIICGAPNVKAGQKVVVAKAGTTLYKGNEPFKLQKVKIRGEMSEGMICAEDEVRLGDSHDEIIVLERDAPVGMAAAEYYHVQTDSIIEIDLTPNRIDGASHIGVARDLAACLNLNGNVLLTKPSVDNFQVDNNDLLIDVIIENTDACKRYSGITITGINVKESPEWLKQRLLSIGQNPINNVVDVTNFVLHELGHPLHAFDADQITGRKVIIKTMDEGSKFKSLDEKELILSSEDLMICNTRTGMCIAGVFGGIDSGVTEKTKNIFLESAYFNPLYVRRTAKRHGLTTDASYRFERGADPNITVYALKRAAMMIKDIAGGSISSDIVDVYPQSIENFLVELEYANVYRLIGNTIDKEIIKKILKLLDIEVAEERQSGLIVTVPTYRVDVQREADVIEEILRIYGYNNVEVNNQTLSTIIHVEKPDKEKLTHLVSDYLTNNGFNEIISNSLSKEQFYKDDPAAISLYNPLSNELNRLRTTLLYGGLEAIAYNINRKITNLKFYEFGNCYSLKKNSTGQGILKDYHEEEHLGLFITGNKYENNWIEKEVPSSFYQLKSYTENILKRLNIEPLNNETSDIDSQYFSEGLTYFRKGEKLVSFGMIHQDLLEQFELRSIVFAAELNWTNILKLVKDDQITFRELPKFPEVRRDLSMILLREIKFSQIKELAYQTEKKLLREVSLFDVYEGDKIEGNKKSYAVSFILQDFNRTLKDTEIDKIMARIAHVYEVKLNAQIRR